MVTQRLVLSLLLVLLTAVVASANTVEYVRLEVISDSTRARNSFEHEVRDSRIQGFRMPFIRGEKHRVTIIGHMTDFLQKVQIFHGGRVVRAVWKDYLNFVGHTDEHGGKGKIVFDLDSDDLPAVGQSFQIRIRFNPEFAGFDKLDCKVVDRGRVQRAEWSTENGAELPEYAVTPSGVPHDRLRYDRKYTLNFTCFKCPSNVQIFDGLTERLLGADLEDSSMLVSGGFLQRKIRVTFKRPRNFIGGDVRPLVRFADDGMGNISGGWGDYVYSRINEEELPGRDADHPDRTNLQRVFAASNLPPLGTYRVRTEGTGWGWVTSNPASISCPSFCTGLFEPHTNVEFTAVARADSKFMGWSDDCSGTGQCLIDNGVNSSRFNLTARFDLNYVLNVEISGVGSVTGAGEQISCPSRCRAESQTRNASMELLAQAGPGQRFLRWEGACTGDDRCSVVLAQSNQTVRAIFTR